VAVSKRVGRGDWDALRGPAPGLTISTLAAAGANRFWTAAEGSPAAVGTQRLPDGVVQAQMTDTRVNSYYIEGEHRKVFATATGGAAASVAVQLIELAGHATGRGGRGEVSHRLRSALQVLYTESASLSVLCAPSVSVIRQSGARPLLLQVDYDAIVRACTL
jgi:hypothetical protein